MQFTKDSKQEIEQQQYDSEDLPPPYSPPASEAVGDLPTAPHLSDIRHDEDKSSYPSPPPSAPAYQVPRPLAVPDALSAGPGSSVGNTPYENERERRRRRRRNRCCGASSCKMPAFINDCQRKDGRSIPPLIEFPQDLRVTLRGHIGGGRITIQQHSDHDRAGSIETTVQATDRILNKTTYCVDLGHETIFDINFPSSWFLSWGARVEMTIKMPYHATRLLVDTSNMPVEIVRDTMMDVIHVKTTNNSIKITDDWDGKRMELETTNSSIEADRARIYADEAVKFSTTNAQIKVDKVIVSEQGTLQLKTTNAKIEGREVRAGTSVRLDTTNATIDVAYISALNGPVQVQTSNAKIVSEDIQAGSKIDLLTSNASIKATYLRGPWIDVKTSNSSIGLGKVLVANRLTAETSFGELNANIEALSPDLNATFSTTFSKADIHMPIDFQGRFDVSGQDTDIGVLDTNELQFIVNEKNHKQGIKRSNGPGAVFIKTSNNFAQLTFDTPSHYRQ